MFRISGLLTVMYAKSFKQYWIFASNLCNITTVEINSGVHLLKS